MQEGQNNNEEVLDERGFATFTMEPLEERYLRYTPPAEKPEEGQKKKRKIYILKSEGLA